MSSRLTLAFAVLGRRLIDANLLFALADRGVRDKVTPLVGIEYAF